MITNGGCCGVDIRFTQNCVVLADRPESGFLKSHPHQGASDSVISPPLGIFVLVVRVRVVYVWVLRRRYRARYWLLQGTPSYCLSVCRLSVSLSVCMSVCFPVSYTHLTLPTKA